jgi:putative PIG3 family NAD(P)H quinone oxidoreductase
MRPRQHVAAPNPSRGDPNGTLSIVQAIGVRAPGGPEMLELVELPTPRPGPGEVLIKVLAAGMNRADLLQRQGHYPPPPGAGAVLGLEVSGYIAELGPGVTGWEVGDACVALLAGGGYAAYVVAPAGQVVLPPEGIDLVAAAGLVEVAATVQSNLEHAGLATGDVFLVHGGAGGIGSFAIPYAKHLGATVITTAGSPEKLAYSRARGADHALSYRDDWPAGVREAVGDHGVDVIMDNMGAKYLEDHVQLLAVGGRLVVIGLQGGTRGTLDLGQLLRKRGWVHAASLRSRPVAEKAAICRAVVNTVWPLLADGTLEPVPYQTFPLAEAAAAHALMESGEHTGKIILVVD